MIQHFRYINFHGIVILRISVENTDDLSVRKFSRKNHRPKMTDRFKVYEVYRELHDKDEHATGRGVAFPVNGVAALDVRGRTQQQLDQVDQDKCHRIFRPASLKLQHPRSGLWIRRLPPSQDQTVLYWEVESIPT